MEISKQDWLLFRKKIGEWQEAYMEKLLLEYADILRSESLASEKFWELEKRIKNDRRSRGVVLEIRKQNVIYDLVPLHRSPSPAKPSYRDQLFCRELLYL